MAEHWGTGLLCWGYYNIWYDNAKGVIANAFAPYLYINITLEQKINKSKI